MPLISQEYTEERELRDLRPARVHGRLSRAGYDDRYMMMVGDQ